MQFHVGFQVVDRGVGEDVLNDMQRLQLTHVYHVDVLRIAHDVAIGHPVDALEVVEQLVPRHDMNGLLRIALVHLVQGFDTNLMLDGPFGLHHALGIFVVIAHHLEKVLIKTLDGIDRGLLLLVGIVVILLRQ